MAKCSVCVSNNTVLPLQRLLANRTLRDYSTATPTDTRFHPVR